MPQPLLPLLLQPLVARWLLMLPQQTILHFSRGQMHTKLHSLPQVQGSSSKSSRGGAGWVLAASALPHPPLAAVTARVWASKQPHQLLPLPQPLVPLAPQPGQHRQPERALLHLV